MSFGKNPHVAKAELAEQKAREARDEIAREQAWLEAARRWDRAAERETDAKRKQAYFDKGEHARALATQPPEAAAEEPVSEPVPAPSPGPARSVARKLLN
jgi:hypothetical protein